uniref:Putative ovule protein n=1 Tax=Solanum chacoense TaxID=4108 RepID=A0A0V0GU51_SOLCH
MSLCSILFTSYFPNHNTVCFLLIRNTRFFSRGKIGCWVFLCGCFSVRFGTCHKKQSFHRSEGIVFYFRKFMD